jgi:hypothetical protein
VIPVSQRAWALGLAAGCLGWVGLAFGRTSRMAELVGTSPGEVRALGVRDAVSAVTLVAFRDPRPAIAARAAFDLSDAARYGRGRPAVLVMTLGFGVLGLAGLLTRRG